MLEDFLTSKSELNRLAQAMQNGQERAASSLYQKLMPKVYGFCISRVQNKFLAEDITQDIFLKLVGRIETYDSKKGDFVVWFWQLARNTLIDHYRKQKDVNFTDLESGDNENKIYEVADTKQSSKLEAKEKETKIKKILGSFTKEEQELFELRFIAELSYKEIAGMLKRNEGALRVSVNRLRKKINERIKHEKI